MADIGSITDRRLETDEQSKRRIDCEVLKPDQMYFSFACSRHSPQGALLVLVSDAEDNLCCAISFRRTGHLTYDEFNYILQEFLQKFVTRRGKDWRPSKHRPGVESN